MTKFKRLRYEIEYFDAKYPFAKFIVLLLLILFLYIGKSNFIDLIITVGVLTISVILHEVSHGYMTYFLGDDTAKNEGRLSLNPIRHIDLQGLLMPLMFILLRSPIIIGSAKPVPINYYKLKNKRLSIFLVSIAGISMNLLIAIISTMILKLIMVNSTFMLYFYIILSRFAVQNIVLFVFNLFPIPPLDGSKIALTVFPKTFAKPYYFLEKNPIISFAILYFLLAYTDIFEYLYKIILRLIS